MYRRILFVGSVPRGPDPAVERFGDGAHRRTPLFDNRPRTSDPQMADQALKSRPGTVADALDAQKVLELYAERTNAPPEIIRDSAEVQAIRQQRAEQQEAVAMAQAAPQLASASKDLAQAEQIRQGG